VLDPGPQSFTPSTHKAFSALLDLLGWRYDSSGEKRVHEFGGLRCGSGLKLEARMAGATVEETAFEDVNMWQAPVSQKPPLMGT